MGQKGVFAASPDTPDIQEEESNSFLVGHSVRAGTHVHIRTQIQHNENVFVFIVPLILSLSV